MKIDEAVIKLLELDPGVTVVGSPSWGGSSSASTLKMSTRDDKNGVEKHYFVKTGSGKKAEVMFRGEYESLRAIHDVVPSLCPYAYGHGAYESSPSTYFLVEDLLDISSHHRSTSSSSSAESESKPLSLAQKLARLHTTPAPIPPGYEEPQFGFPVTTCCGDTPQDNTFTSSWAEFYANSRLRFILRQSEKSNGADEELRRLVEDTAAKVVPRLLGDTHLNHGKRITPVVVHGDLWSGNASRGIIGGEGVVQDVVYDSSACYAHNEYELGIMNMFGGFGGAKFLKEYHELVPKTEPVTEYEDRVRLYELYHHLNHHALFGGGYRSGAVSIMQKLIRKYGK